MLQVKKCGIVLLTVILLLTAAGCGAAQKQSHEGKPVEFTVVELRKLPEKLTELIEENKKQEIRMTYMDGEDMYLVRGYGEQKTGGYSIVVSECTEDETTVWLDTQLIGPENQERLSGDVSYPCLVIKMEARDKEVMIQ